jgi:hypothetical protein
VGTLAAGVAIAAQELGRLRLQGRLQEQLDRQPAYLLQDLAQLLPGGEELIDLGTEAFAG